MKQTFTSTDELIKHAESLFGQTELYYVSNDLRLSFVPQEIHIIPKNTNSSYVVEEYNKTHDFCVAVASFKENGAAKNIVPAEAIYKKIKPLECYVYVSDSSQMIDGSMVVKKPSNKNYKLFREVIEETS